MQTTNNVAGGIISLISFFVIVIIVMHMEFIKCNDSIAWNSWKCPRRPKRRLIRLESRHANLSN